MAVARALTLGLRNAGVTLLAGDRRKFALYIAPKPALGPVDPMKSGPQVEKPAPLEI